MKKVLFLAVSLFAAVFAANAEESGSVKPAAGKVNVEVGFCPFSNLGGEVGLENGRLNGGYSINNKLSVRVGLGWNAYTYDDQDDQDDKDDNDHGVETKKTDKSFIFAPGIVYSFSGTRKFTPYVGGELILGVGNETTEKDLTVSGLTASTKTDYDNSIVGLNAFTGMNYYFSQNLYVGVEFGIGFSYKSQEDGNGDPEKTTSFAPYAQPSVRLGWAF